MPRSKNPVQLFKQVLFFDWFRDNWAFSTESIFDQGNVFVGPFVEILTDNSIAGFGLILQAEQLVEEIDQFVLCVHR